MKRLLWSHDLGKIGGYNLRPADGAGLVFVLQVPVRCLERSKRLLPDEISASAAREGLSWGAVQAVSARRRNSCRTQWLRLVHLRVARTIGGNVDTGAGPLTPGMPDARRAWRSATLVPYCGYAPAPKTADPARAEARGRSAGRCRVSARTQRRSASMSS